MNTEQSSSKTTKSDALLGLVILLALLLLVGSGIWFKNIAIGPSQQLAVLFHNVAGLNTNAAVCLDGVKVGVVEKVEWIERRKVMVTLRLTEPKLYIPCTASFRILSNGLVGARYVDISLPADSHSTPPLSEKTLVWGIEPVRPEIIVDDVLTDLHKLEFDKLHHSLETSMRLLARAADDLSTLSRKAQPALERAPALEDHLTVVANDVHVTVQKLNKLMDHRKTLSQLALTIHEAHDTVTLVHAAVERIQNQASDPTVRSDVLTGLKEIRDTASHIEGSLMSLERTSKDAQLRNDAKQILTKADQTLCDLNSLLKNKEVVNSHGTLDNLREASRRVNLAARQINQILDKRHPLLHLIFGRPGRIKDQPERLASPASAAF